jgi:mannose-6-phosphate isomerase-like protein (cupin superfamily)
VGDETGLIARLRTEGFDPSSWGNGPGDRYAPHEHGYDKVLVVAAGSIRFGLPERGETVDLAVGDRLDLPGGTVHDATVGPDGVTCLEAHAPVGTLPALRRRTAGDW